MVHPKMNVQGLRIRKAFLAHPPIPPSQPGKGELIHKNPPPSRGRVSGGSKKEQIIIFGEYQFRIPG